MLSYKPLWYVGRARLNTLSKMGDLVYRIVPWYVHKKLGVRNRL